MITSSELLNTEHNLSIQKIVETPGNESVIDNLERTATEQLNRLLQQERTMDTLHSNLDLLMKRYNIEKSYFSTASDWYGELSWWIKLLLGLVFAGIGAGIGAIFNMPIVMCCVLAGLYLFTAFLFMNHYTLSEKRNKQLCEDIIEMEKSLAETIEHLSALEASLKKVMISLCKMNGQMTQDLKQLEEQLSDLNETLNTYSNIIQTLTEAKDLLVTSTSKINTDLAEANSSYHSCHNTLLQSSNLLNLVTNNIGETNSALLNGNRKLDTVSIQFHQHTEQLTHVTESMSKIVLTLKTHIDEDQNMREVLNDKLTSSIDTTLQISENTDDLLLHSKLTISEALIRLDEYDKNKAVNDEYTNDLSAEIRQITEENKSRFDYVATLLKKWDNTSQSSYWI